MNHDEVSHRDGQDPYAHAPETEAHYGERIRYYSDLLDKKSGCGNDGFLEHLEKSLQRYQGWLDSLIASKRASHKPIDYDYAEPEDVVFIEGECPFSGGGTRYTKQDVRNVCMGDDIAGRRLASICAEHGAKRFEKVSEDGYESLVYNDSLADIRKAYGSSTVYNRAVLVHDHGKLTEIVFDRGLDEFVGEYDPVSDYDEWNQSLGELREGLAEFSRRALGVEALLVRFSPSKNLTRGAMPLFEATAEVTRSVAIETHHACVHTDLPIENDVSFINDLSRSLGDAFQNCAAIAHARP